MRSALVEKQIVKCIHTSTKAISPFCIRPTPFTVCMPHPPLSSYGVVLQLPMSPVVYKYAATALTITPQPIVWIVNIKPIRDYVRQCDHQDSRGCLLLLFLPWAWLWRRTVGGQNPNSSANSFGRVACTTDDNKSRATLKAVGSIGSIANGHLHETPLPAVLEFLPLQQAFGEYCRKALCSEASL